MKTLRERILEIKEFCEQQFEDAMGDTKNLISFESDGIDIVNPFTDETGRYRVEPVSYYGEELIEGFIADYNTRDIQPQTRIEVLESTINLCAERIETVTKNMATHTRRVNNRVKDGFYANKLAFGLFDMTYELTKLQEDLRTAVAEWETLTEDRK